MNLLLYSWGGAIIDIVALSLIILITVSGAKQGFIKTFLSTFGWIISLLLSVLLCGVVARFVESKFGYITSVSKWLESLTVKFFGNELMNTTLAEASESGMNGNLADWIVKLVLSAKNSSDISDTITINQIVCPTIAYYIVCVISLICLFVLFKIAFYIIADISKIKQRTVVGKINSALGGLFGIIKAVVILDFIIIIINAVPLSFVQTIATEISNSIITSAFSKLNVITILFNSLMRSGILDYLISIF